MNYDRINTPEYWDKVWLKWRWDDKKSNLLMSYDRANTPDYWDKMWSSPKRRYEKYSMQRAWWLIREVKAKSVLDVGCGNGRLLYGVRDLDCFGIDISQVGIDRMKKEFGIEGKAMNLYDLNQLDRKFDFVVCNHTLEHLSRDKEAVQKMKDKLNPEGTFYSAVPNNMSSPEETEEHCQMYNSESLSELLTSVFGNCKIEVIGNHLIGIAKNE
jgi:2-polyprenyl-3-methyl-5-hydroxy-6-metoxy-1,4-benzoquinol methylase